MPGDNTTNAQLLGLMLEELTGAVLGRSRRRHLLHRRRPVHLGIDRHGHRLAASGSRRRDSTRTSPRIPALPEKGYGFGIEQPAVGWVGHGGQTLGWSSFAAYNPPTGATFAGFANSPTGASSP